MTKFTSLIERYAREEKKDSFFPHVTLVSKINSHEKAIENASIAYPIKNVILLSIKYLLETLTFKNCI